MHLQSPPESWAIVDIDNLNVRVEKAVAADKPWPSSPLLLIFYLFGDDQETRSVVLEEVKNSGERANASTVSYIRDGFLDDSVRGDWHEVNLRLLSDGTWRISKARVAYRCWRTEDKQAFQGNPCP